MSETLRLSDTVQTIPEALAFWAEQTPDAIAFLSPGREPITYRQLHEAVEQLATELRAVGLGRQDGIALLLPEGPELCLALLAAMAVGIAIPLAWPSPEPKHSRILANRWVHAVVAGATELPVPSLVGTGVPIVRMCAGLSGRIDDVRLDGRSAARFGPTDQAKADDIALILHSSGTTGRPKLVPRLHHAIVSTCRALVDARSIATADRSLSTARAGYSQGINALMLPIFAGASAIITPELDLAMLPEWFKSYRPTFLTTTPAVLRLLAKDHGMLRDALREAPLRCIHSTAGPISTKELCDLEATLELQILNGYGMSEAPGIAGERYVGFQRIPGAVGVPWCEVQIMAEPGVPVGPTETGEIVVRGPRVFPGYLDDPEANSAAFLPGGWFRTGDVGFLDEAGYLHLTGRLTEIVNRGGEKIAPAEVDRVLVSHPGVADAAVFAVPDRRLGNDIVAAVVLRPETVVSPRELRGWMLDRLVPFKVPRRIWMVDDLPRTPTGKVQRGELARRWSKEQH